MSISITIDRFNQRKVPILFDKTEQLNKTINDFYLFCFIEQGYAQVEIDSNPYICFSPAFLCLNEKQTLRKISSKDLISRSVCFLPKFINMNMTYENIRNEDYYNELCLTHDLLLLRPFIQMDFSHSYITGLTPEMVNRANALLKDCEHQIDNQPDWYWSCRTRSNFLDCLHLMERLYYSNSCDIGQTIFDCHIPAGMQSLANAINYIWSYYSNPDLTATDLVRMFGSNKAKLNEEFKQVTNKTIYQYILDYRLYAATRKLRFTELTVEEIAFSCGFSSAANFSAIFKQKKGISPNEFRKSVVDKRRHDIQLI